MAVCGWFFRVIAVFALLWSLDLEAKKISTKLDPAYVMPADHPIKPTLDALFQSTRATFNLDSLVAAGFNRTKPRKTTKLCVTKHPDIPGYVFKFFLDFQYFFYDPEYAIWVDRINTVNKIREEIIARGLQAKFKVPHKWIYVLPTTPKVAKGYAAKEYILVAEDMDLISENENEALWKSDFITEELLTDLYSLVSDLGLRSFTKPENIPFSNDGTIAFIDTQFMNCDVEFEELTQYLSPTNQAIWKRIYKNSL
jgi:hypothetical protein